MELDLAQLDALSHAVSEGTFEAAARALHVTPSAVSQRIKALETGVGRILLERSKPVRPTPSGESLLRLAVQLRAMVDDVAQELGAERRRRPRHRLARRQRRQPRHLAAPGAGCRARAGAVRPAP